MARTLVVIETLRSALRQPLFWLLVAVLLASWRALEIFMPLGLATEGIHRSVGHYEVAFVGGALSMLLVIGALARMDLMLRPTGAVERTLLEIVSLVTVAVLVGALVLIPAHALELWQYQEFHAVRSIAAGLVGWVHFAAILVVIGLRLRPVGARHGAALAATAAVALAFLAPGWLTGATDLGRVSLTILDVGGILRTSFDFPPTQAHWLQACVPIVGWGAVAAAIAAPARSPDPAHALRDPR